MCIRSKHAQVQFAKLVSDQLLLTVRELRRKVDESAIQDIIQSCCEQFEQLILPDFENNGRDWTVEFEMPSGAPGLQYGRLKFTNAEIAKCLNRSVIMIEKMLESMVAKHMHEDITVSVSTRCQIMLLLDPALTAFAPYSMFFSLAPTRSQSICVFAWKRSCRS